MIIYGASDSRESPYFSDKSKFGFSFLFVVFLFFFPHLGVYPAFGELAELELSPVFSLLRTLIHCKSATQQAAFPILPTTFSSATYLLTLKSAFASRG